MPLKWLLQRLLTKWEDNMVGLIEVNFEGGVLLQLVQKRTSMECRR